MAKMIRCSNVDPELKCKHIVFAGSDEDVLRRATEHAREHGISEVTPEMMAKVRAAIRKLPWMILETQ